MLADRDELVRQLGSTYGRLCYLVAGALSRGHPSDRVLEASRGKGASVVPVYQSLRAARAQVNSVLLLCRDAGVPTDVLLETARQTRSVIESEFSLRIPKL